MVLLFLVLVDKATMGIDLSANTGFTEDSGIYYHSFENHHTTFLWKMKSDISRGWAELS